MPQACLAFNHALPSCCRPVQLQYALLLYFSQRYSAAGQELDTLLQYHQPLASVPGTAVAASFLAVPEPQGPAEIQAGSSNGSTSSLGAAEGERLRLLWEKCRLLE